MSLPAEASAAVTQQAQQAQQALHALLPPEREVLRITASQVGALEQLTPGMEACCFEHCLREVNGLALLAAADRLLAAAPSTLWLLDSFVAVQEAAAPAAMPSLAGFLALAKRMGWRAVQQQDLGRPPGAAAGCHDWLLQFEREAAPRATLVPVAGGERDAMQALFSAVFGHPLSAQEWDWKYRAGGGRGVGLVQDGELVAHYGGMPREVMFKGRPAMACQVCDVMVAPQARSALTRRGPLQQITATFLEMQIGWGLPHLLGFGFPTDRHFEAADRLKLYASVDSMVCASWPAAASSLPFSMTKRMLAEADLAPGSRVAAGVDGLWQAMAAAFPQLIVGLRDARWLRHRYLQHPRFRYELVLLRRRWSRRCVGLAVLRQHETHLEWVDAVAEPGHWRSLLALVRDEAAARGLPRVEAWITASQQALLQGLSPADCTWRPLGIQVPANVHTPGPAVEEQRHAWLLMAGDTDFR